MSENISKTIYAIEYNNGEDYEDECRDIITAFSTQEEAEKYVVRWDKDKADLESIQQIVMCEYYHRNNESVHIKMIFVNEVCTDDLFDKQPHTLAEYLYEKRKPMIDEAIKDQPQLLYYELLYNDDNVYVVSQDEVYFTYQIRHVDSPNEYYLCHVTGIQSVSPECKILGLFNNNEEGLKYLDENIILI